MSRLLRTVPWIFSALPALWSASAAVQDDEELFREFRAETALMLRRGAWSEARFELEDLLSEEPDDWRTRAYLARVEVTAGEFEAAAEHLARVYREAEPGAPELLLALEADLEATAELATIERLDGLLERVEASGFELERQPRLAWPASQALLQAGRRERAEALLAAAAARPRPDWASLLASGRAAQALGDLVGGSSLVVDAAEAATTEEAGVMAELAWMYFEAEGEGQRRAARGRAPGPLFRDALERNPKHERALLGLHALGKVNWRRQRTAASEYVTTLLEVRPNSVDGRLARAYDALTLGRLREVREALDGLEQLAPRRREVRTLRATLSWVEHDRDEARAMLAELAAEDPADSAPERELGAALIELYRFSEALEFVRAATERDPDDHRAWTRLGEALANTGDPEGGLAALERATDVARGRHDVWRANTRLVLERIERDFEVLEAGGLSFAWNPLGAEVLEAYLVPFYREARRELALRYGYSSGPVRIEVFDRHEDFSVRSVGFQGFPALGVCFGPVVTAVSPISELRGTFSWARTSYHEFTHVVHLGLSNNRCPRWITEGLATWEEERVNPAWGRNMRRDLLDARANDMIFPLRQLNAAFRGSRIVFGYYQGGLLCEMLIDSHGFPSMIRLLEAFDQGLDLDQACREVFGLTPEQIDARFAEFVDAELAGLHIEPRFDPQRALALRYTLGDRRPDDADEAAEWEQRWLDVAFSAVDMGRQVDAQDALRRVTSGGSDPVRARLLRGRMALADGLQAAALDHFRAFLEAGGEDFFARMALADEAFNVARDTELAIEHLQAAEAAFPGFADPQASAELALARLYDEEGEEARAMDARMRWLGYNADAGDLRLEVARWLADQSRFEEAERFFREANEVDPFRTSLHLDWGSVLSELGRYEEAVREADVALAIPTDLDADGADFLDDPLRARLEQAAAEALEALGERGRALERARRARDYNPDLYGLEELLERLGG